MVLAQDSIGQFARRFGQTLDRVPAGAWLMLLIVASAAAYLPFHLTFGKSHWLTAGLFGIQSSRIGFHFLSFVAGAFTGPERPARAFERQWARWPLPAIVATVAFFMLDSHQMPSWGDGVMLALFSTIAVSPSWQSRFASPANRGPVGNGLSANAYGIHLMHWPIVLWLQLVLLGTPLAPLVKAALVMTLAFGLTWLLSSVIRRLHGVSRAV